MTVSALLDINRISLERAGGRIGRRVEYFESLDSTSDEAWRRVEGGEFDGLVVFAEHQAAGRGRLGRSWDAPRGAGLLMSVVVLAEPGDGMTSDGGVKIMDFPTRSVEPGTPFFTLSHMSPERGRGNEADARSDLWNLGVVLYHCLTGRLPFEGDSAVTVISRILSDPVVPPTSLREDLPMDLNKVVLQCLEKDPGDRFQSADDLLERLRCDFGD